MAREGCF
ncbi:hypothetical protein IEO21_09127 [Rhodonia placenta]|nr:hypothetical protein IEO21_09127 [Postia placenta]